MIKFIATLDNDSVSLDGRLVYARDEYSFNTLKSKLNDYVFTIEVNYLSLWIDAQNKVFGLSGFSSISGWIETNLIHPKFKAGCLSINIDFVPVTGIGYRVTEEVDSWPVYFDRSSGWICIGNPYTDGTGVEFINNCVGVVDSNAELVSLWLKPEFVK